MRFPTGGKVRDPLLAADLVRFQNRQYSLDEEETFALVLVPRAEGISVRGFLIV